MKDSHGTYDGRKDEPPYECPSCSSLRARAEKAEAALCRAREFLDTIGSRISDSSPCPHEAELKGGDYWQERAKQSFANGTCPCCFCTDEGPHEKGCEWYEMEYRIRILEKSSELSASIAVSAVDLSADKESVIFAAEFRAERAVLALKEFHALVGGECSSLLNEDSGGSGRLDAEIREIIDGPVKAGRK